MWYFILLRFWKMWSSCRQRNLLDCLKIGLVLTTIHRLIWCYHFQIRYVFLLFVAIFLGFCMNHVLHPSRVNSTARHVYSLVLGTAFGLICFGFVYVAKHHCALTSRAILLQADDVLTCCGRHLLCVCVNFITKSGSAVSNIP